MESVIVSDFGVMLGQASERLVVRGPRPRLELLEGGPQLWLPLDLPAPRRSLREQMAAYGDRRGLEFGRAIVRGKVRNQAGLLKYFGKYQKNASPETFEALSESVRGLARLARQARQAKGARIDDARAALMAIEGASGRTAAV